MCFETLVLDPTLLLCRRRLDPPQTHAQEADDHAGVEAEEDEEEHGDGDVEGIEEVGLGQVVEFGEIEQD